MKVIFLEYGFDYLTKDKIYDAKPYGVSYYLICDNFGEETTYGKWRFITLKEQRKLKLKKLNYVRKK